MKYTVMIRDAAFYDGVEADSIDEAINWAYNWFHEREHTVFVEPVEEEED